MQKYRNLEFFNKSGNSCNFIYDETLEYWYGNIYINKVSTGLIETEHIFIYEKVYDLEGNLKYVYPLINENISTNQIQCSWDYKTIEEFFVFNIENDYISRNITMIFDLQSDNSSTIVNDIRKTNAIVEQYLNINIGFLSENEESYENVLTIYDLNDNSIIAKIAFYCEAVGEDLRFDALCNNLGYFVTQEDLFIYNESDINEARVDYQLLNRKRKELLLEGNNIFPFIGSYKGLINAIHYFGFDDLKVREYWKNINIKSKDYGKFKLNDVINIFDSNVDLSTKLIDTKNYRKTNNIALVYFLNTADEDNIDQYDIPIVTENYQYTIEEVVIKLFALKQKLKRRFLPYNIEIKDIIGEAVFHAKKTINTTQNINTTIDFRHGIDPQIELLTKNDYIIDLRDIDELVNNYDFDSGFVRELYGNSTLTAEDIGNVILAAFKNYYPHLNTIELLPDKNNIPIGCPVVLKNTTFDIAIGDINAMYSDLTSTNSFAIDFVCNNVGNGDTFRITETVSNTYIEYTATNTDTIYTVTQELFDRFSTIITLPWVMFVPSIVDDNGIIKLRIFGKSLSDQIKFDFQTSTTNGFSPDTQTFTKYYIPQTSNYTYKTIGDRNYYEVEWKVYNSDSTIFESIRGNIDYYRTISIILPYTGTYDVELTLYDTNNMISTRKFHNIIDVKMKEADFIAAYRRISDKYNNINSLRDIKLSEHKIVKYRPLIVNETQLKDCLISYKHLSMTSLLPNINYEDNYLYTVKNFKPSGEESFPGPFTFKSMGEKFTFKDLKYLTYNMTQISGDTPASFNISKINYGGKFTLQSFIEQIKGYHTFGTNNLKTATDELNASKDQIISKYVYNYVANDITIHPDKIITDVSESLINGYIRLTSVGHGLRNHQPIALENSSITEYNIPYIKVNNVTDDTFDVALDFISSIDTFDALSWNYPTFIHAAAKTFGQNGDLFKIDSDRVTIEDYVPSKTYGFLVNDYQILKNFKQFEGVVYIVFASDNCKIPGKDKYLWTIVNNITGLTTTYRTDSIGNLFWEKGNYTISLEITDGNGNTNSISRNMIKIV